jgi:hypothetical protein
LFKWYSSGGGGGGGKENLIENSLKSEIVRFAEVEMDEFDVAFSRESDVEASVYHESCVQFDVCMNS